MENTFQKDGDFPAAENPLFIQSAVALPKDVTKNLPHFNKVQMKLFFVLLEHINWKGASCPQVVLIDNQLAKARLKWSIKSEASVAKRIRDTYKSMITIPASQTAKGAFQLIWDVYGNKEYTAIALTPGFALQMSRLLSQKKYFRFKLEDILHFRSQYSMYLYIELRRRQKYILRNPVPTEVRFSTKQLKDILNLDIESYTNRNSAKGHFDRTSFERNVLQESLEELSHSEMLEILPPLSGVGGETTEFYRKTKYNGNVKYYYIRFRVREEIFNSIESSFVNFPRFQEIEQGFATERDKKKYKEWLENVDKTNNQFLNDLNRG